ncbi:hypothetical protein C9993_02690 [Marinobacter sp. Z-F4-2]|nr:hypothetical protein C9993_02690 [Marinobacter sp. Z-F4-2]
MSNQFLRMGQRLSAMLVGARPSGLSVRDLIEDFLPDAMENELYGPDLIRDPMPVFEGRAGLPDYDGQGHLPQRSVSGRSREQRLVNFLPSDDGAYCCSTLIVVSLSGNNAKGSGHLKFCDALEHIVRHSQGACSGITRNIVLLTDCWVAKDYQKWFNNLENIKTEVSIFETYLIGEAGRVAQIDL